MGMSMADVTNQTKYMTAAEYLVTRETPACSELIHGKIVKINPPSRTHGAICAEIVFLLKSHCKQHDCGTVFSNDSGALTETDPDTVRGMDVAYCSYERIPKGELHDDYSGPLPEVIFEVLSKTDRWPAVLLKIAEYLNAEVEVVCIVDPKNHSVRMFRPDGTDTTVTEDETLSLPEIKPTFQTTVASIFS